MAFGLPVLGTDSGGTREIVEHNVTGLLHPLGRPGSQVLAQNFDILLENPSAGQEMGMRGREKVEKMYMKKHMFQIFQMHENKVGFQIHLIFPLSLYFGNLWRFWLAHCF